MSKPVLFASRRPLERAENIKAVFDAYEGEKRFAVMDPWRRNPAFDSDEYDLLVADEVPASTPGKCIFIGHGIGGGKTYGLDQPVPYMTQEQTSQITYAICTSPALVDSMARMFRIPKDRVLALGMPRTDAYVNAKKGDGKTHLARFRSYLYCPTYFGAGEVPDPIPTIDLEKIDRKLEDGEMFFFKNHMVTRRYGGVVNLRRVHQRSPDIPTGPDLIDCDVLITDYSSIAMDAHLLHKPVVLFAKDRGWYVDHRGMYLDYPQGYASRFCDNEEDLVDMIREATEEGPADIECCRVTAGSCDGHSTERLIELIEETNR